MHSKSHFNERCDFSFFPIAEKNSYLKVTIFKNITLKNTETSNETVVLSYFFTSPDKLTSCLIHSRHASCVLFLPTTVGCSLLNFSNRIVIYKHIAKSTG